MFFKKKQPTPDKDVIFSITENFFAAVEKEGINLSRDNITSLIITGDKISLIISISENIGEDNILKIKNYLTRQITAEYKKAQVNIIFTNDGEVLEKPKEKSQTPKPPTPKSVEGIKKIIAVASGKGGVGKSTVAVHLALAYAKTGHKTGLVDADIHGPSIARMMGISGVPEIENNMMIPPEKFGVKCMSMGFLLAENAPVVWRGPMVTKALHQLMLGANWGELDVLVMDLPPGTGDIQLSIAQNYKVDGVVLVSTPQEIALLDVKKAASMFSKVNIPIIGVIENMAYFEDASGNKNYVFGKGAVEKFCSENNLKYLCDIPINPDITKNCDEGTFDLDKNYFLLFKNIAESL